MNIAPHILEEVRILLESLEQGKLLLPIKLGSAEEFYLADTDDETIVAFTAYLHEGTEYKVGVRRI